MKANKSMIDCAYEILKEEAAAKTFAELWGKVKAALELTDEEAAEKIGQLYTDLTLDGRFIMMKDSTWDLRDRHTRAEVEAVQKINGAYTADSAADADAMEGNEEGDEDDDEKSSESEDGEEPSEGSRAENEVISDLGYKEENKNY